MNDPQAGGGPPGSRLMSVDALRGFDMFWIMGGDYVLRSLPRIHDSPLTRGLAAQMEHCEWAGFHLYQIIELWQLRRWAMPFVWIGMNALTIYIIAAIVNFHRLSARFVGGDIKAALGNYSDLVSALVTLALVFWVVNFLYRRKVFLRL